MHPDITNFLQENEVIKTEGERNCLIRTQNPPEKFQTFSQDPLIYPNQDVAIEKIRDPLDFAHENFKVHACPADHQDNKIRELQEKSLPFHNESKLKYRNWYGHVESLWPSNPHSEKIPQPLNFSPPGLT